MGAGGPAAPASDLRRAARRRVAGRTVAGAQRAWDATEEKRPRWEMAGTHPVVQGVDPLTLKIEKARPYGAALTAVAQSAQGTPLVYVADTRERRFVVLTFGPAESNLASAPGFPVLMGNAIDWLVRPEAHGARTDRSRDVRPDHRPADWARQPRVPLSPVGGATLATLRTPGLYTAETAGATSTFAVNVGDPQVSNLARTTLSRSDQARPVTAGLSGRPVVALLCDRRVRSRACRVVDVAAPDHRMTARPWWLRDADVDRTRRTVAARGGAARVARARGRADELQPAPAVAAGERAVADADRAGCRTRPSDAGDQLLARVHRLRGGRVATASSSTAIEAAAKRIDDLNAALRPVALPHRRLRRQRCRRWTIPRRCVSSPTPTRGPRVRPPPRSIGAAPTSKPRSTPRARSWPPAPFRASCCSPTATSTGGDTDAALAHLVDSAHPRVRRAARTRDRSATRGLTISICPNASRPAQHSLPPSTSAASATARRSSSCARAARSWARNRSTVAKGVTAVTIDAVARRARRARAARRRSRCPAIRWPTNNTLERGMWVDPRRRCSTSKARRRARAICPRALTGSGFDVTVRPPVGACRHADAQLDPFDVVVLSDVARAAITAASMAALAGWVEQDGGGLLVAGGEAVFGEGEGYRKTPIERLTPVTFERRDEPEVALILVLDRSWSMAGSVDGSLQGGGAGGGRRHDRRAVARRPHLQRSVRLGRAAPQRRQEPRRHPPEDRVDRAGRPHADLPRASSRRTSRCAPQRRARSTSSCSRTAARIRTTTRRSSRRWWARGSPCRPSPSARPPIAELLRNIAKWGKGRAYQVADAKELPQIFVKEAKNAATPAFDEKQITPVVKTPAFLTGVDLDAHAAT